MVCVIVRLRRCFVRIDCLSAGIGIGLAIVAAAARIAAGFAAAGGRRTVIHLIHSLELLIRNGIRGQVAGTDYPGFLVIIVVSTVDLLSALGGHFVDIAVLIGVDIQGTGTVGSGLALEVDEVDVGVIIVVSEVLVVLGVVSQVQLALTTGVEYEVSIVAELYGELIACIVGEGNYCTLAGLDINIAVSINIAVVARIGVGQSEVNRQFFILFGTGLAGTNTDLTYYINILGSSGILSGDLYPVFVLSRRGRRTSCYLRINISSCKIQSCIYFSLSRSFCPVLSVLLPEPSL